MNVDFSHAIRVAVVVRDGDKVLCGKRRKECVNGAGCLAFPTGVVAAGESVLAGATRILFDLTGLRGKPVENTARFNDRDTVPQQLFRVPGVLAVTDHTDVAQQRDGRVRDQLTFWIHFPSADGQLNAYWTPHHEGWAWHTTADIAKLPGGTNPTHPQYFWTPVPLLQAVLPHYFGRF